MLRPEQKKKRQEYNKWWYDNLSPEREEEVQQKIREYNRNRYHNVMVIIE